jgi:hypothetical protein
MINAVTYILNNNAGVRALLGLNEADTKYKVYPVVVPLSEKFPYIACRILSAPKIGKSCNYGYTVQVNCYDKSYDEVGALATAAITALESQKGVINGVTVSFINYIDQADDFVDSEPRLYVKSLTFEGVAT